MEITLDQLKDMLNNGQLAIKLQGATCLHCHVVMSTIEAATEHDAICDKHPLAIKLATAEAERDDARRDIAEYDLMGERLLQLCRHRLGTNAVHGSFDGVEQLATQRDDAINCRNIAIQEKRDIERDLSAATSSLSFCREALAKVDVLASRQLSEQEFNGEDRRCILAIASIAEFALGPPAPDGSDEELRAEMEAQLNELMETYPSYGMGGGSKYEERALALTHVQREAIMAVIRNAQSSGIAFAYQKERKYPEYSVMRAIAEIETILECNDEQVDGS